MTTKGHGGELVLAGLADQGVDAIFTLSGGHIFPVYDACVKSGVRIVDVRHEQTATFAAEGVAKLTRRPGVAVLTAGPGVTNGVSATTTAHFNGSPLIVLAGRAPQGRWGAGSSRSSTTSRSSPRSPSRPAPRRPPPTSPPRCGAPS